MRIDEPGMGVAVPHGAGRRGGGRPPRSGAVGADRIFISYRRADSGGWARSLHDNLDERLGSGRAFRDVAMEGGVDFHEHVEGLLDRCDVLLAVIGKRWASITDEHGNRRLEDPGDLVRREIARALERPDVEVIPVLVDGARMPSEAELPPDLAALSRRQACELTDSRWDYDVDTLARRLRVLLGTKPPRRWHVHWAGVAAAGLVIAAIGMLVMLLPSLQPDEPATKAARLSNPTLDSDITFGQYLDRKKLSRKPYTAAQLARRGAYLLFDFRVQGFKGKRLPLRWQLIDAETGDQIDQSSAISIQPDADTDQASWDYWVPFRPGHRRMYVELQLYGPDGRVPIGRLRTARYHAPRAAQRN